MIDIVTVTTAIGAATSAVNLFDKIADQIERFISKSSEPSVPKEHRMKIEELEGAIVSKFHGQEHQRITADDLKKLPELQLRHISVLEKSMENHYRIWVKIYPELALIDSPVQKAKVEQQLENIIRNMKGDFEGILSFLESCGLHLDDHYMHIRHLVRQV
jgi:hypothetical protein